MSRTYLYAKEKEAFDTDYDDQVFFHLCVAVLAVKRARLTRVAFGGHRKCGCHRREYKNPGEKVSRALSKGRAFAIANEKPAAKNTRMGYTEIDATRTFKIFVFYILFYYVKTCRKRSSRSRVYINILYNCKTHCDGALYIFYHYYNVIITYFIYKHTHREKQSVKNKRSFRVGEDYV